MKHDELAFNLAMSLRSEKRMVWTDMQLGPSGSARPDVYTLMKSYTQPNPTTYEVKISVIRFSLRCDFGQVAEVPTVQQSSHLCSAQRTHQENGCA